MGFKKGAFAKVWSVDVKNDLITSARVSISRKNQTTGMYEQDFSGFIDFVGSAVAKKAAGLKSGTSIKLGDVDVTTSYNSETKVSYTNYKVYGFEVPPPLDGQHEGATEPQPVVDEGEPDNRLPF